MALTFYYGSGSQYAWRVWLALELKSLEYDMQVLSFSEGDLKKPAFAALNPRRKVPVLVDAPSGIAEQSNIATQSNMAEQSSMATPSSNAAPSSIVAPFVLYESAAIVEYLDEAYPDAGTRLYPGDARSRALVRRMVSEADSYVSPAVNRLLSRVLFTPEPQWKEERIAAAGDECSEEFQRWDAQMRGEYLVGPLSAADITLYPMVALAMRCEKRKPSLAIDAALPPKLRGWMQAMERLPCVNRTWPPHWEQP